MSDIFMKTRNIYLEQLVLKINFKKKIEYSVLWDHLITNHLSGMLMDSFPNSPRPMVLVTGQTIILADSYIINAGKDTSDRSICQMEIFLYTSHSDSPFYAKCHQCSWLLSTKIFVSAPESSKEYNMRDDGNSFLYILVLLVYHRLFKTSNWTD